MSKERGLKCALEAKIERDGVRIHYWSNHRFSRPESFLDLAADLSAAIPTKTKVRTDEATVTVKTRGRVPHSVKHAALDEAARLSAQLDAGDLGIGGGVQFMVRKAGQGFHSFVSDDVVRGVEGMLRKAGYSVEPASGAFEQAADTELYPDPFGPIVPPVPFTSQE